LIEKECLQIDIHFFSADELDFDLMVADVWWRALILVLGAVEIWVFLWREATVLLVFFVLLTSFGCPRVGIVILPFLVDEVLRVLDFTTQDDLDDSFLKLFSTVRALRVLVDRTRGNSIV